MTTSAKLFLGTGGLAALAAVALGAFGAHALKTRLSTEMLALWHTGIEYHVHSATHPRRGRSERSLVVN